MLASACATHCHLEMDRRVIIKIEHIMMALIEAEKFIATVSLYYISKKPLLKHIRKCFYILQKHLVYFRCHPKYADLLIDMSIDYFEEPYKTIKSIVIEANNVVSFYEDLYAYINK